MDQGAIPAGWDAQMNGPTGISNSSEAIMKNHYLAYNFVNALKIMACYSLASGQIEEPCRVRV